MNRRTLSAVLAICGAVCLIVCNVAIERHAVAPVPVRQLGLPAEAVAPFREFVASLPPLSIVGAESDADNRSKRVVLDSHLLRVGGGQWPWHGPQETGDCAAMSIAGGIEIDTAVQSEQDPEIVWRPVDRGAIYGGGRVTIGKGAIKGDGLVPSWGLQYVDGFGILWQDQPEVPPYSGRRMDEWGRSGVPAKYLDLMKPFAGLQFAACRSAQDVCNAINAGCPVPFGSMRWGTDRIKLVEGRNLAFDTTDWPHAEIVTGYDGTLANGQRLFRILNSWGPNAHSPKSQMPGDHPGGYYVTWETMDAICKEGMTYALSGANGFRQRQFVPDFSVIGAAGPLPDVSEKESAIMFPLLPSSVQGPGSLLGCVCLFAAVALVLFRGSGARRLGVAALLVVLSLSQTVSAQAPDFQSLTRAAQPTTPPDMESNSLSIFDMLTAAAQPSPVVSFDMLTTAAQAAPTDRPDDVIVFSDPNVPCPHCVEMKREVGEGDADCKVGYIAKPMAQWDAPPEVKHVATGAIVGGGLPVVQLNRPAGKSWVYGKQSLDQLKARLRSTSQAQQVGLRCVGGVCLP